MFLVSNHKYLQFRIRDDDAYTNGVEAYTGLTSSDTLLTGSPSSPVSPFILGFHKDLHEHFHEISPPIVEMTNVLFGRKILQADLVMHIAQNASHSFTIVRVVPSMKTCIYFMNPASDMVSHVCSSTEITTKYMKPSYEMTSMDSKDDTTTISQAWSYDSTPSHTITQVQEDPTIPSRTNLDTTLSISANMSVDVSYEIDPHPIVTIGPSLTETRISFNSHLIIEDIIEAKRNSDVDDFLADHDPAQNSDCELALTNNTELATFNKFHENIFDATSHRSSMISLQTSIQSKASEYTKASAKLIAQEHLVEELKAKLIEAEDIYGNLWCSIQHTIDEAKNEKK
ncbi:hypothetical protein FNV43_RR04545 [Rhamnella rubrinervis]|uniref:Uncharacterized protein n=1 Tax=Rhamnella rubrinervis TaxID=2594499 RepID=A0A8K0HL84_9ROSA|nr:hypothetical protein FNV43_RR04545 [Rhamnella rubrinervis]